MEQKEIVKQALREVLDERNILTRPETVWISPSEAARIASVHIVTVNRWLKSGQFGAYAKKVGSRWRISSQAPQLQKPT